MKVILKIVIVILLINCKGQTPNDAKKRMFQIDLPLDEHSGKVSFEITLLLDEVIL